MKGRPRRKERLIQVSTRITPTVNDRLRQMAKEQGRSLANLMAWILTQATTKKEDNHGNL